MSRPHLASLFEDAWNTTVGEILTRRGWDHLVVPHTGYGSDDFVRVLARVVHVPGTQGDAPLPQEQAEEQHDRRGWRSFVTAEVIGARVRVRLGEVEHETRTDRSGNVDVRLPNPGWAPGWHEVVLESERGRPAVGRVLVIGPHTRVGIVSDIDDTVLRTLLPRPLVAAYNTFVLPEDARRAVPGMALLYRDVLRTFPGAPTIYLSTGAWNVAGLLRRFLAGHGYPEGPLLLTDWGPTNTGWFRSGQEHKRAVLRSLGADFPHVRWLLVGDDGQHDPALYGEFAREQPEHVLAIAIRELGMGEQVLAHGTPTTLADSERDSSPVEVAQVRGADGWELAERLGPILGLH